MFVLLSDRGFDGKQAHESAALDLNGSNDLARKERKHSIDRDFAEIGGHPHGHESAVNIKDSHWWPPPSIQARIVSGFQSGILPMAHPGFQAAT
jgi:hypothetical protein